ncbi:hypothetical protein [Flexivirga oryzae]|uniref:Uncharacterized protein n=1 Tax=Flexivirga oryzae TaxID=1794944 RepID=A0A839NE19_9MICO|nr:hypothetical protein [Flexivirga oryzae]MBB2894563.1 hypothetical protein [Flexivirga oryzae]
MPGETVVGSIVAYLRMDASDYNRTLAEAGAAARALGQSDPNIEVTADTGGAVAGLAAVQAEADHLDGDDVTVDVRANTANAVQSVQRVASAQAVLQRAQERSTQSSNALRAAEASLSAVQQRHTLVGQQLAQAEQRLSDLRSAESPDANAIQAAEQRLAQARQRSASASASLIGAENRVENARSAVARASSAASRAEEDLAHSNDDLDRHQQSAHKSALSLIGVLATMAPATVPIAGAVAGLGAAFGGLGAAGVLAFLGVKKAMEDGTAQGQQFSGALDTLKGNLGALEVTAAAGILTPFVDAVKDLQPKMPAINNGISVLSGELGQVAQPAVDGITTAFVQLLPLMTDVSSYAVKAANAFDKWAQSDSLQQFGGYAMSMLPQVVSTFGELVQLAGNAARAFAPFGGTVLSALQTLAGVINSLPTGALQTLATTGVSVYLAFKSYGLIVRLVGQLGSSLGTLSANLGRLGATRAASSLQGVASAMRNVENAGSRGNLVAAGAATVVGIATVAWTLYKQKQQEAKQAQEELTQAIQADNGVLGDQTAQIISQRLASTDAMKVLGQYGVSQKEILTAIGQGGPAWDKLNQRVRDNATISQAAAGAAGGLGKSVRALAPDAQKALATLKGYHDEIDTGKAKVKQETAYQKALGQATGNTAKKLTDAQLAQMSMGDATLDSTGKVQKQNQAIQALNQALDAEISKQLQLQGGLTGIGAARLQMIADLKKQTDSTSLNTKAGISNRQSIEQVVSQLQAYKRTQEQNHVPTKTATADYRAQGKQLLDVIANLDGAKSSTYKYAQQLLKIPKSVSTRIHVSAPGAASVLATIDAILRAAGSANAGIDRLRRHGAPSVPAYAAGTDNAPGGLALVGERGAELVLGPQVRYLQAGTRVLNHQQTMEVLTRETVSTTTSGGGLSDADRALLRRAINAMENSARASAQYAATVPAAMAAGYRRNASQAAQSAHLASRAGGVF